MTNPLDELRQALCLDQPCAIKSTECFRRELLIEFNRFAATHRLIDITVCGEQCPAWDEYLDGEGNVHGNYCYAVSDTAPVGRPCIWRQP